MKSEDLDSKSAAIIVGASAGIGEAMLASLISAQNFKLIVAASRSPLPEQLIVEAKNSGICLHWVKTDVELNADISALAEQTRHLCADNDAELALVIYTVGLLHNDSMQPERKVEEFDAGSAQRSFAVNAIAPLLLFKTMLPLVNHGNRAVFASLSARVGSISDNRLGGWYSYRASKAAQNQLLKTFSIETKRRAKNLIVLTLHPGTVDTALSKPFQSNVPAEKLFTRERAAQQLLEIIAEADSKNHGKFYAWDGGEIPW